MIRMYCNSVAVFCINNVSVNQNKKVVLKYNRLTANLNFVLTCRPITLWPAFSFPASKLRACFSAYLTPISIVVWKPLVFAYLGRGKIEYSVFNVYFSATGTLALWPWLWALKWCHRQAHLLRETLCQGWEEVTVPPCHLKVALQSYPSILSEGYPAGIRVLLWASPVLCMHTQLQSKAICSQESELRAFPGGMP